MDQLASETEGYTGADIASLSSAAVMLALREHVSRYDDPKQADIIYKAKIHMKHFEEAKKRSGLYRLRNSICTRKYQAVGKPEVSIADKKEISEAGLA